MYIYIYIYMWGGLYHPPCFFNDCFFNDCKVLNLLVISLIIHRRLSSIGSGQIYIQFDHFFKG